MKSLKRTRLLVLLLVAVLIIPLFQSITINAAGLVTLDHSTFESSKDGWGARYGGSTSRSTDIAYSGNYSLKLINRKKIMACGRQKPIFCYAEQRLGDVLYFDESLCYRH